MKNFSEFMEDVDSTEEKPQKNRLDAAKDRFELQKQKAKKNLELKRKQSDNVDRSRPVFNTGRSVTFNKNRGELPSLVKKKEN